MSRLEKMPPYQLRNFKFTPPVAIHWKPTSDAQPVVLFSNFPRAVAIHFSPKWSEEFPTPGQVPSKPSPKVLTIVGGDKDYAMTFLHWMLACCDGNGFKTYRLPSLKYKPFSRLFELRSTVSAMGIDSLYQDFDTRMANIAKKQIHSEDVRALCLHLPADHPMINFLAKHIADHHLNGTLRSASAYYTVREEIPMLDDAINAILDPAIAERNEKYAEERHAKWLKRQEEREAAKHAAWLKRQDERAKARKEQQANGKDKKSPNKSKAVQPKEKEEDKKAEEVTTPSKPRVVQGAENHIVYLNKNARRRAKKKEQKEAAKPEAEASEGTSGASV
jgi:hypothetical protein